MFGIKFWRRIKEYATKKEKNLLLEKAGCSIRCGWCNTWSHEVEGLKAVVNNTPDERHDAFQCKQCNGWSVYLDFGMGYSLVHPSKEELEKFHTYSETSVSL